MPESFPCTGFESVRKRYGVDAERRPPYRSRPTGKTVAMRSGRKQPKETSGQRNRSRAAKAFDDQKIGEEIPNRPLPRCPMRNRTFPLGDGMFHQEHDGGYSEGVPPLPIPNREVKPLSADGTAERWESRSPPQPKRNWPQRASARRGLCRFRSHRSALPVSGQFPMAGRPFIVGKI